MRKYLTISEFAELRNVNINSLRYYEKLNILLPAWVDPKTNYRYYLPEQLGTLDAIQLCIQLNIPLKNLKNYIDENGDLDEKAILEDGRRAMQTQIAQMQQGMELTEFHLNAMEENKKYSAQKGVYSRRIGERFFVEAPCPGDWDLPDKNDMHCASSNLMSREKTAIGLFHDAQILDMAPVFPTGVLVRCGTSPISYSFFVQVLHPKEQDLQVVRIPESDFLCVQLDITPQTDVLQVIKQNFDFHRLTFAIVTNMPLAKSSFNSIHSEIQIPVLKSGDL